MKSKKSLMLLGAALALGFSITPAAHAQNPMPDPAGRWAFDEPSGIAANDSTEFGNTGYLSGAALLGFNDLQKGSVLSISGISGNVTIPYSSRYNPAAGTVSVWVKPTLATTADIVFTTTNNLVRCDYQGVWYAYGLRVTNTGSVVGIIGNDNPKNCQKAPQILANSPSRKVALNTWTHIAMSWDGIGTLTVYANGKKAGSASYSPNPNTGLSYSGINPLMVSASRASSLEFVGQIRDLRVYEQALSDEEIGQIYQGQ
jgi:hypothetical protein